MDQKDFRVARIALENGWASEEQVQELLRQRVEAAKAGREGRSLATMLVEGKIINNAQYTKLMDEVRRLIREKVEEYQPIGELLVEAGVLDAKQLSGALAEQANQPGRRVGEILIENGWVSYAQILSVLKVQSKSVLTCPHCTSKYNVVRWNPATRYTCRRCSGPLSPPARAESPAVPSEPSTRRLPAMGDPEETTRVVARAHQTASPLVGAWVILGDGFEGDFGKAHRAWRRGQGDKDAQTFLVYIDPDLDDRGVRAVFEKVRERAKASNIKLSRVVEVGDLEGKHFMAVE